MTEQESKLSATIKKIIKDIKNFFGIREPGEEPEPGKENFFDWYQGILKQANIKVKAHRWFAFGLIVAIIIALVSAIIIFLFLEEVSVFMSAIFFLVAIDLFMAYPYLIVMRKVDTIEEDLPNALRQMADTLKAGGTYEAALRQVATSEYGPLTKEIELVLRKTEEGESLEDALKDFAKNSYSRLVQRTVTVINDTLKAGAGLADVLDDIADDMREMHRIEKERQAETLLQVLFMIAAGTFIAPAILGLVSSIIVLFISSASQLALGSGEDLVIDSIIAKNTFLLLMQIYILFEIIASSIMIALMRNGKANKSVLYAPIILMIAYIIYYSAKMVSGGFLSGI